MNGQQADEKMLNITNHQGNTNQNHRRYLTCPSDIIVSEQLSSKRHKVTIAGEDVEKRESCALLVRL